MREIRGKFAFGQRDIMMSKRVNISSLLIAVSGIALLSGCTGTSTYGTGKTQEAQLLEDLTSVATIGSSEKKAKINYISRPGLVKPPQTASLPAPTENVESQSGYFPVSPEQKRANLLKAIADAEANGDPLPEEVVAMRKASIVQPKTFQNPEERDRENERFDPQKQKKAREAFLKQQALLKGTVGAADRQWLTEPPKKYRSPETTAEVGSVGEKESDPYKYKDDKTNLFDWIRGKD